MAPETHASSPYRKTTAPRTLTLHVGAARTAMLLGALLGLGFLASAGRAWWGRCTVDSTRRTWIHEGCVMHPEDRAESSPLTISWLLGNEALPGTSTGPSDDVQVFGAHASLSSAPGPLVLLLMALVAFAGPSLVTERAKLTLDEGDGRVRIRRFRIGRAEAVERPLADLVEAVLARRGWATAVTLVFRGGERLDLAAPTNGDAGHAKVVRAVTDFLARKA